LLFSIDKESPDAILAFRNCRHGVERMDSELKTPCHHMHYVLPIMILTNFNLKLVKVHIIAWRLLDRSLGEYSVADHPTFLQLKERVISPLYWIMDEPSQDLLLVLFTHNCWGAQDVWGDVNVGITVVRRKPIRQGFGRGTGSICPSELPSGCRQGGGGQCYYGDDEEHGFCARHLLKVQQGVFWFFSSLA
jgi:hypothetical protein